MALQQLKTRICDKKVSYNQHIIFYKGNYPVFQIFNQNT